MWVDAQRCKYVIDADLGKYTPARVENVLIACLFQSCVTALMSRQKLKIKEISQSELSWTQTKDIDSKNMSAALFMPIKQGEDLNLAQFEQGGGGWCTLTPELTVQMPSPTISHCWLILGKKKTCLTVTRPVADLKNSFLKTAIWSLSKTSPESLKHKVIRLCLLVMMFSND